MNTNRVIQENTSSPIKQSQRNFLKENKELCTSARNMKVDQVSATKADMFIASTQRHKEIRQKDL